MTNILTFQGMTKFSSSTDEGYKDFLGELQRWFYQYSQSSKPATTSTSPWQVYRGAPESLRSQEDRLPINIPGVLQNEPYSPNEAGPHAINTVTAPSDFGSQVGSSRNQSLLNLFAIRPRIRQEEVTLSAESQYYPANDHTYLMMLV